MTIPEKEERRVWCINRSKNCALGKLDRCLLSNSEVIRRLAIGYVSFNLGDANLGVIRL
jgi:hypothetical protein